MSDTESSNAPSVDQTSSPVTPVSGVEEEEVYEEPAEEETPDVEEEEEKEEPPVVQSPKKKKKKSSASKFTVDFNGEEDIGNGSLDVKSKPFMNPLILN